KAGKEQAEVGIKQETTYPFGDTIHFTISTKKPVEFPLHLRIPGWCKKASLTINGQAHPQPESGKIIKINKSWKEGDSIVLKLPMEIKTAQCGRNARAIERGPLVYALKLQERWEKGHDEKEGDYFSVYPKADWNYGLRKKVVEHPETEVQLNNVKPVAEGFVWNLEHAPIELTVAARKIPGWGIMNDVAPSPVTDRTGLFRG